MVWLRGRRGRVKLNEDDWYRVSELLHTLLACSLGGMMCSLFAKLEYGYFIFGGLIIFSMMLMYFCELDVKSIKRTKNGKC